MQCELLHQTRLHFFTEQQVPHGLPGSLPRAPASLVFGRPHQQGLQAGLLSQQLQGESQQLGVGVPEQSPDLSTVRVSRLELGEGQNADGLESSVVTFVLGLFIHAIDDLVPLGVQRLQPTLQPPGLLVPLGFLLEAVGDHSQHCLRILATSATRQHHSHQGVPAEAYAGPPGLSHPEQALLGDAVYLAGVELGEQLSGDLVGGVAGGQGVGELSLLEDGVGTGGEEGEEDQFGVKLELAGTAVGEALLDEAQDGGLVGRLDVAQVEGQFLLDNVAVVPTLALAAPLLFPLL